MSQGAGIYGAGGQEMQQGFFGGPQTGFAMSPQDYASSFVDVNQFSGQAAENLFNPNTSNFIAETMGMRPENFDPNAAFNEWTGTQFNQIADLVAGQMSPLDQALTDRAQRLSNQNIENVGSRFAGQNALFGSGFGGAVGEAAAAPFADAAAQLNAQQLGMVGQLGGQQLGLGTQNQQFLAQLGAQQLAQQQGFASNLLGLQSQFGMPSYVSPDMVTTAGGLGTQIGSQFIGGLAGSLGGAVGSGIGTAISGGF